MSKFNLILITLVICFIILQLSNIECRPHNQKKIIVHGHEWTVPNEPGWEDILQEAETVRRKKLTNCATSRDCRQAAELLRQIFLKHPVSAKYYDDSINDDIRPSDVDSIFKWG